MNTSVSPLALAFVVASCRGDARVGAPNSQAKAVDSSSINSPESRMEAHLLRASGPDVVVKCGPVDGESTALTARFPWDGTEDEDRDKSSVTVDAYSMPYGACIVHAYVPGYWYEGLVVLLELRRSDKLWEVRTFAMHIRSDLVAIGPDGIALIMWCRDLSGIITVDNSSRDSAGPIRICVDLKEWNGREVEGRIHAVPVPAPPALPQLVQEFIARFHVEERER